MKQTHLYPSGPFVAAANPVPIKDYLKYFVKSRKTLCSSALLRIS